MAIDIIAKGASIGISALNATGLRKRHTILVIPTHSNFKLPKEETHFTDLASSLFLLSPSPLLSPVSFETAVKLGMKLEEEKGIC